MVQQREEHLFFKYKKNLETYLSKGFILHKFLQYLFLCFSPSLSFFSPTKIRRQYSQICHPVIPQLKLPDNFSVPPAFPLIF